MFDRQRRFTSMAIPLVVGFGLAGAAMGASQADSAGGPLRCEIETRSANGMVVLAGVVHADTAVNGSYRFRITGAGTEIDQGGAFTAGPGAVTLGRATLGGDGAYDASLTVTADGHAVECEERVGGFI